MRSLWKFPFLVVSKSLQELANYPETREHSADCFFELGSTLFALKDVDHGALCLTFLNEVRQPARAPNCTAMSAMRVLGGVFHHLEAHSTFAIGRKKLAVVCRDIVDGSCHCREGVCSG